MSRFLRFTDLIGDWTGRAVSPFIIVLTLLVVYEVTSRYLFNSPTIWVYETSTMVFGTYFILGGVYTFYTRGHVNVDVIYGRLSPKKKALIDIITFWLFVLFCVVLVWKGGETAWRALRLGEHSGSVWNPPMYPIKLIPPIGCTLLLLQGVAKFIRDVTTLVKGHVL